jgi:hypothetical protein
MCDVKHILLVLQLVAKWRNCSEKTVNGNSTPYEPKQMLQTCTLFLKFDLKQAELEISYDRGVLLVY